MREKLLEALKESNRPVSGQVLASKLSVSRTAVWKHVEQLRRRGYDISGTPKIGYKFNGAPKILITQELTAVLPPEFKDRIAVFDQVDSTSDIAKDMAAAGKFKPLGLVIAETQTQGRGRFGRHWVSPSGGIWMSLVLRPKISAQAAARMALLAATAVAGSIDKLLGPQAKIKWPNDILINGKKVAGILIEMAAELGQVEYLIVGIGVNANLSVADLDIRPKTGWAGRATSLEIEAGQPIDRLELISLMAGDIVAGVPKIIDDFETILQDWRHLSDTLGKTVTINHAGLQTRGLAVDIDHEGGLAVETSGGELKVFRTGEVTMERSSE